MKKLKATCYACERDSEEGVWIDERTWAFYCPDCYEKYEEQSPNWEYAEKRYLTDDNNTYNYWRECIWCNTMSHDNLIEYDDNGKEICPECKRHVDWTDFPA